MSLEHIAPTVRKVVEGVGGTVAAPEPPTLPHGLRQVPVHREMFISQQHLEAWKKFTPLRRHLQHRKKLDRDLKEAYAKGHRYQCAMCACTSMLQLDHIVPSALGGSSKMCNLRYLCGQHNLAVARPLNAYLRLYDAWLKAVAA